MLLETMGIFFTFAPHFAGPIAQLDRATAF